MIRFRKKKISKYDNISPIDFRYSPEGLAKELLCENARIRYLLQVECALAKGLAKHGVCSKKISEEICQATSKVNPDEVYKEEGKVQHDIMALVNCIRNKVSNDAKPYVHLGAASEDIKQTAESLRIRDITKQVLLPELLKLEKTLMNLAFTYKDTPQIGRTHGQHAAPITFGFSMSSYVSRLGKRISKLTINTNNLKGKLSGIVGAHNELKILVEDPDALEIDVLKYIGLKRSAQSSQVLEPENVTDYVHSILTIFGILANLADDIRHLERTEIGELTGKNNNKINSLSVIPARNSLWQIENIKSLYKQFMPRMITVYLDQISEHQRDLTNSASSRWIPEFISGFLFSVKSMERNLSNLVIKKDNMKKNIELSKNLIIAQPLCTLLLIHKHPEPVEFIEKLLKESKKTNRPLIKLVLDNRKLQKYIKKFSKEQIEILNNPEKFIGNASEKVDYVCQLWSRRLKL